MPKYLFTPMRIGKMEVSNRLVVPAMVMNFCNNDGTATEKYIAYHEAKAKGGWGLIITEDYAVDPRGKGFIGIPGLWNDDQIESHSKLPERVHRYGSKIVAQIYHAGRQTNHLVIGAQPVAPSPIPCPANQEIPHELTKAEIRNIVEEFGDCTDEYGGSLLNRIKFPLEIISNIRAKAGNDFPIIFRISGDEFVPGGRTIEDTKAIAVLLEQAGINAIHVSAGVYGSMQFIIPPSAVRHGWIADFAAEVKKVVSIPVITVGRITDPIMAETIIASGKADFVSMGRASLADPELPNKTSAKKFDDINYCIGCLQGCVGNLFKGNPGGCLVNPVTGRESEFALRPVDKKKKVFVAGGGPAGMEAAIVAAQRGHEVHLYEKSDRLGGQYLIGAIPPNKGEVDMFLAWQQNQLKKYNVNVHFNTELTVEIVEKEAPDAVIVATGGEPLLGNVNVGHRVIVIGGGMVGSETADHLANHGKEVTIVEMLPDIAIDEEAAVRYFLMKDLHDNGVKIFVNAPVKEILDDGVISEIDGAETKIGPADTIVMAIGAKSVNNLTKELEGEVPLVLTIGDALKVRKALEAVEEGYRAGLAV